MSRKYPARPILGVGAVVVSDHRALLIRRGNEPAKGEWSIPGGMVEPGERVHDAVIREVMEETGLLVEVGQRLAVVERIFRDSQGKVKYHYILLDYRAIPKGGELRAATDAAEVCFFARDGLEGLGLAEITKRVVIKALAPTED